MTEPGPLSVPSPSGEGTDPSDAPPPIEPPTAPASTEATPTTPEPSTPGPAVPRPAYPTQEYPNPQGYPVPGQSIPQGYTVPQGYAVPPGYGVPPGYAVPPGYRYPTLPRVAPGGAPLAEIWERFAAYVIDSLVIGVLNLIPIGLLFLLAWHRIADAMNQFTVDNDQIGDNVPQVDVSAAFWSIIRIELVILAIALPLSLLISFLYMVTFMHGSGQTPGKRLMKIHVVRSIDGGAITLRMAVKRWLVAMPASIIAPYFSYADSLWLLWDQPYRQCLHDKCAETVVVKIKP